MDVQTTDHNTMLLKYVTSYVSKFKGEQTRQSLYSRHVTPCMAAYRHLSDMKPLEPEMVISLSAHKPACSRHPTKRYIPPRSTNAHESAMVIKYCQRPASEDHLSLIQWLRTFDTNKANPTPYKRSVALVVVKFASIFNPEYFFQYLLLQVPLRTLDTLKHVDHDRIPNDLKFFAAAIVLQLDLWDREEAIIAHFSNLGHKQTFVSNVVSYVTHLRNLYYMWQLEIISNEQLSTPSPVLNNFDLNTEQQRVLHQINVFMNLRCRHYASLRSLNINVPCDVNNDDSDSEDDNDEEDNIIDEAPRDIPSRPRIVEQQYTENDPLNDWTKETQNDAGETVSEKITCYPLVPRVMANSSPTKKVSYFGHFPHYFLKPYGGQQRINTNTELLGKLNTKNCEWLLRPNVALSEYAQTIQENLQIVQNSTVFTDDVKESLQTKLAPLEQTLQNLNSNDKTTSPNSQDGDDNFDNYLAEMMYALSALYVATVQMRAMRAIMTHTDSYATKIACDHPSAAQQLVPPAVHVPALAGAPLQPPAQPMVQQAAVQPQNNPMMDMLLQMQAELAQMRRERQANREPDIAEDTVDDDDGQAKQDSDDESSTPPEPPKKRAKKKKRKKNRVQSLAEDD
ncbi:hypothetical protein AC249_AIPGENE7012 [Exaiptasia diaphana]|nr:hypothetical protein AC249_AIPGENE7012 [Exaiptasia diaphana]